METRSQPLLTLPGQRRKARSASISSTIPATTNVKVPGSAGAKAVSKTQSRRKKHRLNGDRSSRTRKLDEGKGTAEDPCELLSSDDEVVRLGARTEKQGQNYEKGWAEGQVKTAAGRGQGGRGKEKVKGKSREAERDPPKPQREEPKQHGGFPRWRAPSRRSWSIERWIPQTIRRCRTCLLSPAPSHSDDTPLVFDTQSEFDDDVEGIQGSPQHVATIS